MCETGGRKDLNIIHFVYKNKEMIRVEVRTVRLPSLYIYGSGNIQNKNI